MKYELICIDIDGTLLDDNRTLPLPVKESLLDAAGRGIRIALISGRMPAGVMSVEEELGIECIKACNAGTYIMLGDECIGADYLPIDTVAAVYESIAVKYQMPLWIFQDREWFVSGVDQYVERETGVIGRQPEIMDIRSLMDRWRKEGSSPNKLLFAAKPERIREINGKLQARPGLHISMARSADTFLEIFPEGTDKGKAVLTICNQLGIDRRSTIAFGDHELDIPMLEIAGLGIAMGNAVESLKEKADFVTKTNNEAGIAFALGRYLAG